MLRGGAEGRFRHRSVIAHTAKPTPKMFNDFEEAARSMREQESRKESIFRQSVESGKEQVGRAGEEVSGGGAPRQRNS